MQYILTEEEFHDLVPRADYDAMVVLAARKSVMLDAVWEVMADFPEDIRTRFARDLHAACERQTAEGEKPEPDGKDGE